MPAATGYIQIDPFLSTEDGDRELIARQVIAAKKRRGKAIPTEINLEKAITSIQLEDTIRGSSTMTVGLFDADCELIDAGFFDANEDGRLDAIDVNYPDDSNVWWRCSQIDLDFGFGGCRVSMVFMERAAMHLMQHHGPKKTSRAKATRAEFLKARSKEVKAGGGIFFHSKQLHKEQPIAALSRADQKQLTEGDKRTNKDKGVSSKEAEDLGLNSAQLGRVNTILDTADRLNASEKVMVAIIVAATAESGIGENLGTRGTTFQTTQIPESQLGVQAHYWLVGGRSFLEGGGIRYARQHPSASVGEIASKVEGSDKNGAWYDQHGDPAKARKIVKAYGGGSSGGKGPAHVKGNYTPKTWSAALLSWLHIKQTPTNMQAVMGWVAKEGGHWHNDAKYNPLNTTQNMPGSGDTGSQGNISVFKSWEQGLEATVKTFTHKGHGYEDILDSLKGVSLENIAASITSSDWAPGQYTGMLEAMQAQPSDLHDVDGGEPGSSSGDSDDDGGAGSFVEQYNFEIGTLQEPKEDYWTGFNRLADEVKWPLFLDGQHLYFDPETELIKAMPVGIWERGDEAVVSLTCRWDHRKIATEATLVLICNPFEFRAGEVFKLKNFGAASTGSTAKLPGRWLIESWSRDRFDYATTFTLIQPHKPDPEPASQVTQRKEDESDAGAPRGEPGQVLGDTQPGSPLAGQVAGPSTHPTGNLDGYPARDYFAPAGTPVVSPADGKVWKKSGKDPKYGGVRGGPMGYSVYIRSTSGDDYFLTHIDKVRPAVGDRVKQGEQIAVIAKSGAGSWDNGSTHVHQGVHRGAGPRTPGGSQAST